MNFSVPSSSHFLFLFFFYFLDSSFPVSFSLLCLLPHGHFSFFFLSFLSTFSASSLSSFSFIFFFIFCFYSEYHGHFFKKKKKILSYVVDLSQIYMSAKSTIYRRYIIDSFNDFLDFFFFSRQCTQISIYSLYFEPIYRQYIDHNSYILPIFLSTDFRY